MCNYVMVDYSCLKKVKSGGCQASSPSMLFIKLYQKQYFCSFFIVVVVFIVFFRTQCKPIFDCYEFQSLTVFFLSSIIVVTFFPVLLVWFFTWNEVLIGNWSDHVSFNCVTNVGAIRSTRISSLRGRGRQRKRKRERVHTTFMFGLYSKKKCKAPTGKICMHIAHIYKHTHIYAIIVMHPQRQDNILKQRNVYRWVFRLVQIFVRTIWARYFIVHERK